MPNDWSTNPEDLRQEARDISIGAPDGRGYQDCLRACADRIEELQLALSVAMKMHAHNMPGDSRAVPDWMVACSAVDAELSDSEGETKKCLNEALLAQDPEVDDEPCELVME